jgi:PAS domain S-box-containing protein
MTDADGEALRAAVFDAVSSQLAVLDSDGLILDTNAAWRSFGLDNDVAIEPEMIGENYLAVCRNAEDSLVTAAADGIEAVIDGDRDSFAFEYPCHTPDEQRWFLMRTSPFEYEGERHVLVVHHDITERRLAEIAVEDRNETLETVAGIISHDLRSPLSVAIARVGMLDGDEHTETIERSLERMNAIIDDALVLAREGQAADTEAVELAAVAADAWAHVETGAATLSVETDRVVVADRSLLEQLFENLFRNAVEHGAPETALPAGDATDGTSAGEHLAASLTVTVGTSEDGFFVADDGPGVPVEDRDQIFETGFTTDKRTGTGLGLTIVERIAAVHDWTVDVAESAAGGARFEITGVEFA